MINRNIGWIMESYCYSSPKQESPIYRTEVSGRIGEIRIFGTYILHPSLDDSLIKTHIGKGIVSYRFLDRRARRHKLSWRYTERLLSAEPDAYLAEYIRPVAAYKAGKSRYGQVRRAAGWSCWRGSWRCGDCGCWGLNDSFNSPWPTLRMLVGQGDGLCPTPTAISLSRLLCDVCPDVENA